MREAMSQAKVGDDVYGDDPTVRELEQYAASLTGKEAALFVPSGTFGNQLALFTHCRRGNEVILDDSCHIVQHEAGAASIIAGVQLRTITSPDPEFSLEEVTAKIRTGSDIHEPETSLICLENAQSSGKGLSLRFMESVRRISTRYHIPIHLDGARLFNAAVFLGVQAVEITQFVDSVMFCLSKGLCAPVGSILAGTVQFIEQAKRKRKIMGGGMRQSGILAAAGLISLKEMRLRLDSDHENARLLASKLAEIPGISVTFDPQINMVYFTFEDKTIDTEAFVSYMAEQSILINGVPLGMPVRLVTHYWITKEDIDRTIAVVADFLK
jgi:threonine aldolase